MSLGRRKRAKQEAIWIEAAAVAGRGGHPFYECLNELLRKRNFDRFAEQACASFYSKTGRPGLPPGIYFRLLLVGYFEGIDSERGIAWRAADSLALRSFLGLELSEATPDHTTISRTRRLIDLETHRNVFGWVLRMLADEGLLKGNTIAIDGTTLEANAALRSIVKRDSGERTTSFWRGWQRSPASKRRRASNWRSSTGSGRKKAPVRRDQTGMKSRMKESYEKGVAIHSAPSFAMDVVRRAAKRKQGYKRAGY